MDKLWCIQTVEYYGAIKRIEFSRHEKTCRDFSVPPIKGKKPEKICEGYILYDPNYMTFWKGQTVEISSC